MGDIHLTGPGVTDASLHSLGHVWSVNGNVTITDTDIVTLRLPYLARVNGTLHVTNNSRLVALDAPVLTTPSSAVSRIDVVSNPRLCQALAAEWSEAPWARFIFSLDACGQTCPLFRVGEACSSVSPIGERACESVHVSNDIELEQLLSMTSCSLILGNLVIRRVDYRVRSRHTGNAHGVERKAAAYWHYADIIFSFLT